MANYFNEIPFRTKLAELGKCDFMDRSEFVNGCNYLKGKKVVILGCSAQGLNQKLFQYLELKLITQHLKMK